MEHNFFFWKTVYCLDSQEIPNILLNPKYHYRFHKNLLLVLILSQMNQNYTLPYYFFKNHSNITHLCLDNPSAPLIFGFPDRALCVAILPRSAKCPDHVILDFIIPISGEKRKLWRLSLCYFLHTPATFSQIIIHFTLILYLFIYVKKKHE
jgi:hypothetical protein